MKRHSHRRWAAAVSAATANQRVGLAVSRLDGRGLSRRTALTPCGAASARGSCLPFPDPFPRICRDSLAVSRRLVAAWVRRDADRRSLTSRCIASLAATLTRIAFRAAFWRRFSGGPVAGRRSRRARHWLLRTATCFRNRSSCQERFPFPPVTSVPDDEGKYIELLEISAENSVVGMCSYPPLTQPLADAGFGRCITLWIS